MSNVYEIARERDREMAASSWIAKLDKGLSASETDAFRAWVHADPDNQREMLAMAKLWDQMDALARLSEVFPHPLQDTASPAPRTHRWVAVAAMIFVAVVGLVGILGSAGVGEPAPVPSLVADVAVYETAIGGVSKVELSDGTQLALNTNSRVEINFNERRRVIKLDRGEIHINVVHDPSRPLSVIVGTRIVRAVGTAFSVKIDESQRIEVLVADGRVKVGIRAKQTTGTLDLGKDASSQISGESLLVAKGERVVLDASSEEMEVLEPEEIEVQLSWRDGNLVFHGESLAVATAEISRYTPVEFVLVGDDLKKIRVAGLFKAGDVTGFLSSLEANFDITYQQVDDHTIVLSSKEGASN